MTGSSHDRTGATRRGWQASGLSPFFRWLTLTPTLTLRLMRRPARRLLSIESFALLAHHSRRKNAQPMWLPYTAEDAESMRRLYEEIRARECSFITVIFDGHISTDDFRVYVDRIIRRAGAMDSHLEVPQTVLARVEPGVHSVVFRDRDPRQPNRRESNTLSVEIGPNQRVRLQACCIDGALRLQYLSTEPFSDTMQA